ncbi:MAG: WXG100 family type VII secretion target [Oscillibacter sp.]|nr:WXG100 family type VII secretion target [Oscillibacter sp.]
MDILKFKVNTGTLRSDSASIQREISALKQDAQTLRRMSVRLNTMWNGEAKAEFQSNYALELDALDAAITALERFTIQTQNAGTEYERCERSVSSVIDLLKI